ncbi:MAG: isoleucine--tRNA ligase [Alphaproteobacteria bacterium]|nr:isoleucine--tRNA ligase [Alphaproteobacteria bacterium]
MTEKKYYPDVSSSPDFAKMNDRILDFWQRESTFQQSIDNRPKEIDGKDNEFIFFDGPPFANGLPHYGHLLTGFVKDIIARFQTIKGKRVERRFGWDCHGLPAEMEAEKELGVSGRKQIEDFGVAKFNDVCRKSVMKYTSEWQEYITKQARWVDFENDYKTMDKSYMESSIWALKQLYEKGLVYESKRVMPYSWACQTPLSNFETRMDNSYRERADKAVTVKLKLKSKPKGINVDAKEYYVLAWTTTPWTLPSNLALAVGKDLNYACVKTEKDECLILAASGLPKYKKVLNLEDDFSIYPTIKGSDLENIHYESLFEYFKDNANSFKILVGDFVEEGEGTSVVHIAPGFGEDDQILCAEHGIELVCPVDEAGKFTQEVHDFFGMQVFEANDPIIIRLKEQGNWVFTEQYLHNYPHCWRTDTPLIYKAVPSWYIKVTAIKEDLIKNNQKINWIPGHIKDGMFGKWIANARDWSISRNRFWGTPIPIWKSDNPKYPRIDVYGSIDEIEKDFGVKLDDLHKPYIDHLTRVNPDDPTGESVMRRVPDVFDCWFESGSMPYAQIHYPFENKEKFEKHPSADFIVEYTAQTRGWFYTLMVLSTALFDKPPFLNCICHGVILDGEGQKLSKRLKNYADPKDIYNKYGSDALRFLMSSSSVMRGQELLIDKDGQMISEVVRLVLKPIWNSYNFFTLYANSDRIKGKFIYKSNNLNDNYILSKLKNTLHLIDKSLSAFDLPTACSAITDFFEVLNNWYIRRNRNRFWKKDKDEDKQEAYDTIYTVLYSMSIAVSPLLPILAEEVYLGLIKEDNIGHKTSVHLCDFPDVSKLTHNQELVSDIDKIREICTAALNIRNSHNIRIRQPLQELTIVGKNLKRLVKYFDLVKDELNIKNITLSDEVDKYAKYNLKLNFKALSARLSKKMKDIIAASKRGEWKIVDGQVSVAEEVLEPSEFDLTLESTEGRPSISLNSGDALVMLDTEISYKLELEGLARDFIRLVQQARKTADLHVSDQININISSDDKIIEAIKTFEDYVKEQTLSNEILYLLDKKEYKILETQKIDDKEINIGIW